MSESLCNDSARISFGLASLREGCPSDMCITKKFGTSVKWIMHLRPTREKKKGGYPWFNLKFDLVLVSECSNHSSFQGSVSLAGNGELVVNSCSSDGKSTCSRTETFPTDKNPIELRFSVEIYPTSTMIQLDVSLDYWIKVFELSEVCTGLQALLDSGKAADVMFLVDGEEFPAHSQVLTAASEVFAAMFQHDTKDKLTGRISVKETSPRAFRAMLRHIYSEKMPEWEDDDDSHIFEVLNLAQKYDLKTLLKVSLIRLFTTMTSENLRERLEVLEKIRPEAILNLACISFLTRKRDLSFSELRKETEKIDPSFGDLVQFFL